MNTVLSPSAPASAPQAEQAKMPVRRHDTWAPGDAAHQGDLILVCIPNLPKSAKPRENRQMADGETQGSKHVVDGGDVFDADADEIVVMVKAATKGRVLCDPKYIGPVFSGSCVLTHPQHQHQAFPADTTTVVLFQRNQDSEEREHRARD